MDSEFVARFEDETCTVLELVGGKGASLGRMSRAGFPVPAGFCVTTNAYRSFLEQGDLTAQLKDLAASIDVDHPAQLDLVAADIRNRILAEAVPTGIAQSVLDAYAALGKDVYVAVRSSGTAEDLAEASFAGQHDTYLDVVGEHDVLDAVKRCWASLWTARATAYRQSKGFDHLEVSISVVVQTMVPSEVSGVLFTGNPLNAATDEMVVNASWGLGEAVVAGITTPDEYVVRWSDLGIQAQTLGSKQVQVIRNPDTGKETVQATVPVAEQERFSLTVDQVRELCHLGRRVTEYYGGFPQDIEFAFVGDSLYLLQSRPITGVAFSWDADLECEAWHKHPEVEGSVFTRALSDQLWTGACTPLMYSIRGYLWSKGEADGMKTWGLKDGTGYKNWKYYKGVAYHHTKPWEVVLTNAYPKAFREGMLDDTDPRRKDAVLDAPFRPLSLVKIIARVYALEWENQGVYQSYKTWNDYVFGERGKRGDGIPDAELRNLSDDALIKYAEDCVEFEAGYPASFWTPIWIYFPWAMNTLGYMIKSWYSGSNSAVFADLITGTDRPTATVIENNQLWQLSLDLRRDPTVLGAFTAYRDGAFFAELENSEPGRQWLAKYNEFLAAHYHRGHSDRDIYFPRRSEDPAIDYRALQAFLSTDEHYEPAAAEEAANDRRRKAYDDVVVSLRKGPLGALKVEAFKVLHDYLMRFLIIRDDERHWLDRSTMTIKRCYLEINRRLVERGRVETEQDFYFLGREELYALFRSRGGALDPLTRAKIAGRRANFDAVDKKTAIRPMHIQGYQPIDLLADEIDDGSGIMRGAGTSGGVVTGTARIVKELKEIGSVRQGEILVCNATDPGWTPVFLVIKGIVVETGGMLAHAACIAREYGFPAVQLNSAMQRIPDGATITVDGNTGTVTLEEPCSERASA